MYSIEGELNGVMYIKSGKNPNEEFINTKTAEVVKKMVRPITEQNDFESRKLWAEVTYNLKTKHLDDATLAKQKIEQRQRDEAKHRRDHNIKYKPKYFTEQGEHWIFVKPLIKRLQES